MNRKEDFMTDCQPLSAPICDWEFSGVAIPRGEKGTYDADVAGDPCIVWDPDIGRFRMIYFAQRQDEFGGEVNTNAQAVSISEKQVGAGEWIKEGPLTYTNPEKVLSHQTHKPWILMDPFKASTAARVEGKYWLFTVSYQAGRKCIQLAHSDTLSGPWTVQSKPVLEIGAPADFDGYHVDTITAYWFEERGSILLFYKGYPAVAQADQTDSPFGSSLAAAEMKLGDTVARKLGKLISPSLGKNHWQSGWVSGLQLFPARNGGWYGLQSGSPTPPVSPEEEPDMREPAPSLGGWSFTPEAWPVSGWQAESKPIIEIDDLPQEAVSAGMQVNLWRHHMLLAPDGNAYLYCNSGGYGQERMFVRTARIHNDL